MRFSKTLAILIALNTGAWIIPQEVSAQQILKSNHIIDNESNSNVDYLYVGEIWAPCLYPISRQNLSNIDVKNEEGQNKAGLRENEVTVHQSGSNDTDQNPLKVVIIPVEDKVIDYNRESVYKIDPAVDIPIVTVGTIWSVYALSKIYTKTSPTVAEIQSLNRNNVPAFDRWAIYPFNKNLDKLSYYPFYASMPLPFLFSISNGKTGKDFFKLSFLYWETMSIVGILGTSATYFVDRYRPYCYTNETPMDTRTSKVSINSFFSGHVEMVAAPTFFIAKVYSDYYPDSKIKWVFYGFAASVTSATSYLRLRAGDHFPSDIILGALVGSLAGILVPEFHKNNNSGVSVLPYSNEMAKGLSFTCQF